MKIVIGIILAALLLGAVAIYLILMLNARQMVFCGDITNEDGSNATVTRVYTTDFDANQTLSEIVLALNDAEGDSVSVEELTEILAEYQNIIYAPVFILQSEQVDSSTYVVTGSVYNGIDSKGRPTQNDYVYDNLSLHAIVDDGIVLCAQNIYTPEKGAKEGVLIERSSVVDPVIYDDDSTAAFALDNCDGFRMIFKGTAQLPPQVTFVYTYDVVTENPFDFTSSEDSVLGVNMTVAFDEDGRYDPEYGIAKNITVDNKKKN